MPPSPRLGFLSTPQSPLLRLLLRPRNNNHHGCSSSSLSSSSACTTSRTPTFVPRRTLIAAPKPNSGPLLTRRADRALPSVTTSRRWLRSLPLFLFIVGGSTLAIFNYQKSSSSVVSSTLYALRTSPAARELLGDEIYFASRIPWIHGELNQLHGRINIRFAVKGTRARGEVRFCSERKSRMGYFETKEWSLKLDDGTVVQLLETEGGKDPFKGALDGSA